MCDVSYSKANVHLYFSDVVRPEWLFYSELKDTDRLVEWFSSALAADSCKVRRWATVDHGVCSLRPCSCVLLRNILESRKATGPNGVYSDTSAGHPTLTSTSCHVILIFDFLNPKVDHFMSLPVDHLCQFASKSVHSFSRIEDIMFTMLPTDERTNKRTYVNVCLPLV